MISFLRISHLYPESLKSFKKNNLNLHKKKYLDTLNLLHKNRYSISNFYSIHLKNFGFKCTEIISNADFLQKKWLREFGNNKERKLNILLQQINFYKCNILYIGNAALCDKIFIDNVRKIKTIKLILAYHCAPFNKKIYNNLSNVDAVITCTEEYKKKLYSRTGKKILFLPHAYHSVNSNLFKKQRNVDLAFVGSIFFGSNLHNNRIDLIYQILKNFHNTYVAINFSNFFLIRYFLFLIKSVINCFFFSNISIFYKLIYIYLFSKKPIFGKEMYDLFERTKIVINTHIGDSIYAGNMRMFEATGSGCLLISDKKKGYAKFFKPGKEIVIFKNNKDLIAKCRYLLKNNKLIANIAHRGYSKTIKQHNYHDRAKKIHLFIKMHIKNNV